MGGTGKLGGMGDQWEEWGDQNEETEQVDQGEKEDHWGQMSNSKETGVQHHRMGLHTLRNPLRFQFANPHKNKAQPKQKTFHR